MRRLLTTFLATAALIGSGDVDACSCDGYTGPIARQVEHAIQDSDFVAEVEVVSTATDTVTREVSGSRWSWEDKQYHPYTEPQTQEVFLAQINILKLWKGAATVKEVSTGFSMSDCGLQLRAGQKVLVYGMATDIPDRVSTGQCMRTKPLSEAGEDIALMRGFAADPVKLRVFSKPIEVFSKYDPAFKVDSVDADSHSTDFKGMLAMTGTLWFRFDAAADGKASGDILGADFVPDAPFKSRLPQVVDGYYPGAPDSVSLGPSDDVLEWTFGKTAAAQKSHGKDLLVGQRVRIVIRKFSTGIGCDRRIYWAQVESLEVESTSAKLAPAPTEIC